MAGLLQVELMALNQCPVCETKERKRIVQLKESTVYECMFCRLRYLDPCLSPQAMRGAYESDQSLANLHLFHEGYYQYGDLTVKSKTMQDYTRALELLESSIPQKGERSIFDAGFGNGFFLAVAKQRGWKVAGSDSSPQNVTLASEKFSLKLACSDFENYDSHGTEYDAVSFWDVIEHLSNPHQALEKAHQMLKPGGFILIGLPNDKSLLRFLSFFVYQISFNQIRKGIEKVYFLEHVSYFNYESLHELLKRNDFTYRRHFFTNTDLARYALSLVDKIIAHSILFAGTWLHLQNRLIAVFQKNS